MTNRTKAIAGLVAVFLLGSVCGMLGVWIFIKGRVHEAQRMRDRAGFQAFFVDRLRLSETQRDSLQDELARTYEELAELRRNTAVQYDAVLDSFKLRVKPILTSEQQAILEQEEKRLRRILPRDRRLDGRGFRAAPPPGARRERPPDAPPGAPPDAFLPPPDSAGTQSKSAVRAERNRRLNALLQGLDTGAIQPGMLAQGPMLKRFRDRLNLSKEQTASVKSALTTMVENIRRDRQEFAGMPRMQMGVIRKNLHEFDASVSAILRPEQLEEYKQIRLELRDSIRSFMGRRIGPRPDTKAE